MKVPSCPRNALYLHVVLICAPQRQNAFQNKWCSQKIPSWSPAVRSKTNKPPRKRREKKKKKKKNLATLIKLPLTSSLRPFPGCQLFQLGIDPNFVSIYKCQVCPVFLDFKNRCFSLIKLSNYFRIFYLATDRNSSLQVN